MNRDYCTHHITYESMGSNGSIVDLSVRDKLLPFLFKETNHKPESCTKIMTLQEKCLRVIKSNSRLIQRLFSDFDALRYFSRSEHVKDLPLDIKAKYIDMEDYYRDEFQKVTCGIENGQVKMYRHSWKRMYLETMFTTILQLNNKFEDDSVVEDQDNYNNATNIQLLVSSLSKNIYLQSCLCLSYTTITI